MKVLVIQQRRGIGDLVVFISYIHAISRKENTPVTILVNKNSKADEFLKYDKHIKNVIFFDRGAKHPGEHDGVMGFFKLAKKIKSGNYEKVYIFNSSFRYTLLAKFAGIKKIFQYPLFKKKNQNLIETARKFTENIVGESISSQPEIFVNENLVEEAKRKYNFSKDFKHICIGLSASGPTKRWDIDKYILTLEKIYEIKPSKFYLGGGKNDKTLIEKVMNSSLGKHCVSFEKMSISETLPIIKNCDFYIGNDTGWFNLSCALGKYCVVLYMDSPILKYSENVFPIVPLGETVDSTSHNTRGKDKIFVEHVLEKAKKFLN